ncbi:MAG: hypothetical protein VB099_18910, partial [Candidatus Limiplasma sp.]|nr:hypothetical protein [Candidatus Limiplasma sp.]
NLMWELDTIMSLNKKLIIILDKEKTQAMPSALSDLRYLTYSTTNDNGGFIAQLDKELSG